MLMAKRIALGVLIEMDKTKKNKKLHQTIGFFRVCEIIHIIEKIPMLNVKKIGDIIRLSTGVAASKKDFEIYRNNR